MPTLSGKDYYNNSLILQYPEAASGKFILNVTWITCITSSFKDPTQLSSNITGMINFNTTVKAYEPINKTDHYSD